MVAAVGELVCFSLRLLCREAAQRITGLEAVSIGYVACIPVSYQKLLRQDVTVCLKRYTEDLVFLVSLGTRSSNSAFALNKNSLH